MSSYPKEVPRFERRFFAAANTSAGFKSDYPLCFGEGSGIERLYVIKGGPGTGKSHLMRRIGRSAEALGYLVTYYYCSSDPASLDGVRMEANGKPCIGVLDGTAPHVWEPLQPGVKEELVNLGEFWNSRRLREHSREIKDLSREKSRYYHMAYGYLHACGEVTAIVDTLVAPCVLDKKLTSLAGRLLKSQPSGICFSETPAHRACIGMTGRQSFDTYEKMAEAAGGEVLEIDECYGLGYELTSRLYRTSREMRLRIFVSRHPIHSHKIDGLYYPDTGLCFSVCQHDPSAPLRRRILLQRYLNKPLFKSIRGEVRHGIKLAEEMTEGACRALRSAGTAHFALEDLYASSMDFNAKEKHDAALCERIFGE